MVWGIHIPVSDWRRVRPCPWDWIMMSAHFTCSGVDSAFPQNLGQLTPELTGTFIFLLMDYFAQWKCQDSWNLNCGREVQKALAIIFTVDQKGVKRIPKLSHFFFSTYVHNMQRFKECWFYFCKEHIKNRYFLWTKMMKPPPTNQE